MSKLHDGEVERCSLKTLLQQKQAEVHQTQTELHQTQVECQQLTNACRESGDLRERVEGLKRDLRMSVPGDRYEEVCRDLQLSLQREKEVQVALSQHTGSIQQLQGR